MCHRPSLIIRIRLSWMLVVALSSLLIGCENHASSPRPVPTSTLLSERSVARPQPGSYAALGASETFGIGATPRTAGYAYLTARILHARRFAQVGIPGATIDQAYDTELSNALALHPYLCTVFFGTNDVRAGLSRVTFLQDLLDLVVTLRRARAKVLIIGLPDVTKLPAVVRLHKHGVHALVQSWNAGMKRIALQSGARYLDLRQFDAQIAAHPEYVASDGLHPSTRGHAQLARVVAGAISRGGLWRTS